MCITDVDVSLPFDKVKVNYLGYVGQETIIENLSKAGINSFCAKIIPPSMSLNQENAKDVICKINSSIFELSLDTSVEHIPVLYVNPDFVDCSCEQIMFYSERGVRLIGNFSANWLINNDSIDRILKTAEKANMVIMLCGESVADVVKIVTNYPNLSVIAGGYRSKGFTPFVIADLMEKYNNLYLNLSGRAWKVNYVLSNFCTKLPIERILFGSGYPYTNPAAAVAAVEWELREQPPYIKDMIFGLNIKRLVGGHQ